MPKNSFTSVSRIFLSPILVALIFLLCEAIFRLVYFGPSAVLQPLHYRPAPIGEVGMLEAVPDRVVGYVLKPDLNTWYQGAPFHSNSRGQRNVNWPTEKPADTFRIAMLGDSVTMGAGVSDDQTYSVVLERLLNASGQGQWQVINFGVGGYKTPQMLASYPTNGTDAGFDLIIVPVYSVEAERLLEFSPAHFSLGAFPFYKDFAGFLRRNFFIVQALRQLTAKELQPLITDDWTPKRGNRGATPPPTVDVPRRQQPPPGKPFPVFVGDWARELEKSGTKVAIMLYPETVFGEIDENDKSNMRRIADRISQESGLPVFNLEESGLFTGEAIGVVYPGDHHPGPKGHEAVARALLPDILKLRQSPPSQQ